jgi:hypothetical protein
MLPANEFCLLSPPAPDQPPLAPGILRNEPKAEFALETSVVSQLANCWLFYFTDQPTRSPHQFLDVATFFDGITAS